MRSTEGKGRCNDGVCLTLASTRTCIRQHARAMLWHGHVQEGQRRAPRTARLRKAAARCVHDGLRLADVGLGCMQGEGARGGGSSGGLVAERHQ